LFLVDDLAAGLAVVGINIPLLTAIYQLYRGFLAFSIRIVWIEGLIRAMVIVIYIAPHLPQLFNSLLSKWQGRSLPL